MKKTKIKWSKGENLTPFIKAKYVRRWVCDWINYYAEIADKKRFPQLFDSELGISEELLDEWEIKVLLFHFLNWLAKRKIQLTYCGK